MERLLRISEKRKQNVSTVFKRYLYHEIDWNQPFCLIKGARGTGKTTMLLQRMKLNTEAAIYLSLDDFYFESNRLIELADALYERGYRHFYLDEVHQYLHWSKDLKNIYDHYPDVRVAATTSSALQVDQGKADLFRRANLYHLYGLSFREFIVLESGNIFDTFELKHILQNHINVSSEINDRIDVLKAWMQYLRAGYYPFFKDDKHNYHQKLQQIIQLTTEVDIPAIEKINYATVRSMNNLLYVVSQSVPFTPNIQSLAEKIGVSRNLILKVLDMLEKAAILSLLRSDSKGVSYLQKPEKIYLENPNLAFTFSGNEPNKGNVRETFFFNQLKVKHNVTSSRFGDFMVDEKYTFEIGGPTKTNKQIRGVPNAFIAADDMEDGHQNKIPLWLFGFLY